ncbi:hypothetical protein Sputw3181_2514 [Shewanella sp. W3-18-1]|nr:hypothetical protein Sputw3181_2514 [Shewanella sp. W3-18-1]
MELTMFFVYGVSMTIAKKEAAKKCSLYEGAHPNRRELSPTEYQAKLNEMALAKFEKMKPQKLSHSLSTPALCAQYIELAKNRTNAATCTFVTANPRARLTPRPRKKLSLGKSTTAKSPRNATLSAVKTEQRESI